MYSAHVNMNKIKIENENIIHILRSLKKRTESKEEEKKEEEKKEKEKGKRDPKKKY